MLSDKMLIMFEFFLMKNIYIFKINQLELCFLVVEIEDIIDN